MNADAPPSGLGASMLEAAKADNSQGRSQAVIVPTCGILIGDGYDQNHQWLSWNRQDALL